MRGVLAEQAVVHTQVQPRLAQLRNALVGWWPRQIAYDVEEVVTSDDSKIGHVAEVRDRHLIVEHGVLKKTRHAIPETFAYTTDGEQIVRLSVSKEIVESSPKLENGSIDTHAVAVHFGLAEDTPAPETTRMRWLACNRSTRRESTTPHSIIAYLWLDRHPAWCILSARPDVQDDVSAHRAQSVDGG